MLALVVFGAGAARMSLANEQSDARPNLLDVITVVNSFTGEFETLLAAVNASADPDLIVEILTGDPVTLFAPTDAAFLAIGFDASNIDTLGADALLDILSFHVAPDPVLPVEILEADSVEVLNGTLLVGQSDTDVFAGPTFTPGTPARLITAIPATNGILYPIDGVLDPNATP